jgi:hypothetical protein
MLLFWIGLSIFLAVLCYSLITTVQRQGALQQSAERRFEAATERSQGELELLQTQLNWLEEETSGNPLADVDLRLLRAQSSLARYESTWGLAQVKQVLRMRIRVLTALNHGHN